ncbi:MAG: hypothetical protein ACREFR_15160 [Limisphaerales bacterium]
MNNFFPAQAISNAAGVSVKTLRRRAQREQWPLVRQGKRVLYQPPYRLQKLLGPVLPSHFWNQPRAMRELLRAVAVAGFALELQRNAKSGIELALKTTPGKYRRLFEFSPRALRRWVVLVSRGGLAALEERKAGIVGRKPTRLERILR